MAARRSIALLSLGRTVATTGADGGTPAPTLSADELIVRGGHVPEVLLAWLQAAVARVSVTRR